MRGKVSKIPYSGFIGQVKRRWGIEPMSEEVRNHRKKMILLLLLPMIIATVLVLGACGDESGRFEYTGRYPEFYTAAIYAVPGVRGFISGHILGGQEPRISVANRDNYGRVIIRYDEESPLIRGRAYVVIQKVDGDYIYFYPFYNHVIVPERLGEFPYIEEMIALEEANNFGQELSDDSEFVRVRITRTIESGPISNNRFVQAYREVFPESTLNLNQIRGSSVFLRTDRYGRSFYFAVGGTGGTGEERVRYHTVMLFQPDNSFDLETGVVFFEDFYRYQSQLKEFMEANGWDTPFEGE